MEVNKIKGPSCRPKVEKINYNCEAKLITKQPKQASFGQVIADPPLSGMLLLAGVLKVCEIAKKKGAKLPKFIDKLVEENKKVKQK